MDIEQILDRQSREQIDRTRRLLLFYGRPDIVAEFDANIRDIRLGVAQARGTWHALSGVQRETLWVISKRPLECLWGNRLIYGFRDQKARAHQVCHMRTIVPLCSRGLIEPDNVRPPRQVQITERGRFILKHGRPSDVNTEITP